jgi:uncharacterized membrane protein YgdD (TMEM256/DUF423 family)
MNFTRKDFQALALAGLLGALAVALGALGAHALKGKLNEGLITPDQFSGFETGVRYHMYHVFALLLVVLLRHRFPGKALKYAYIFFVIGIILFSGSLYLLCTRQLTGADWLTVLGPVTPIGGLLLIAGWLSHCFPLYNNRKNSILGTGFEPYTV